MKKLSISLFALLAIVFAVASAFTSMPKKTLVLEDYVVFAQGSTGFTESTSSGTIEDLDSYSAETPIYNSDANVDISTAYTCSIVSAPQPLCVVKFAFNNYSSVRFGSLQP
jgi:hypothetical protein